jgi:phytoene/squalene synthetase
MGLGHLAVGLAAQYIAPKLDQEQSNPSLAASITLAASKQTYYTIRFLVDRERVLDAYRAYGYFRWLDDRLDQSGMEKPDRLVFVERQRTLIDRCYRGEWPRRLTNEEAMLVQLVQGDQEKNSGLRSYLCNMMAVMAFDAERRGRLISKAELTEYTRHLAVAVTEALHYFIGHGCKSPQGEARYLAVTAAHITHMLRDTLEDAQAGYFNIPREVIESYGIGPHEVWSNPYRKWVQSRVEQARACFKVGRDYLAQVENPRCRMAGYAYITCFDRVLDAIEQDGYRLRSEYPECESWAAGPRMIGAALSRTFNRRLENKPYALPTR